MKAFGYIVCLDGGDAGEALDEHRIARGLRTGNVFTIGGAALAAAQALKVREPDSVVSIVVLDRAQQQ